MPQSSATKGWWFGRSLWLSREHSRHQDPWLRPHIPAVPRDRWVTQVALLNGTSLQSFYEEEIMNCYSQEECYGGALNKRAVFFARVVSK